MSKWFRIPFFTLVLAISACNGVVSVSPSSMPLSGIEGYVVEGPMCPGPVPGGDNPCPDQPYQATISVTDTAAKLITRFQTDDNGYFKITLLPGNYIIHPESDKILPHAPDQDVKVESGQFTQVTIMYDTGMR